jgi:hypothetical protein
VTLPKTGLVTPRMFSPLGVNHLLLTYLEANSLITIIFTLLCFGCNLNFNLALSKIQKRMSSVLVKIKNFNFCASVFCESFTILNFMVSSGKRVTFYNPTF